MSSDFMFMFYMASYILCVAYFTHILMIDSIGPFQSETNFLQYNNKSVRPIGLFDRVRKVVKSPYTIEDFVWEEKTNTVWHCPYCLSFWINLVLFPAFSYSMLKEFQELNTYMFSFLVFSIPFIVGYFNE